jgi:hypothetical protein
MTAGDGEGIPMPQQELFAEPPTWPTPLLACRLAASLGCETRQIILQAYDIQTKLVDLLAQTIVPSMLAR